MRNTLGRRSVLLPLPFLFTDIVVYVVRVRSHRTWSSFNYCSDAVPIDFRAVPIDFRIVSSQFVPMLLMIVHTRR